MAIAVSFIIYMGLAYWVARSASTEELISNYNIMIEKSLFPPLVIAGVLGATFSSALASLVGSSRILYAMGQHRVLPASMWLGETDKTGQPRNAMIVTGVLVFSSMLLRDLNAVAPLVTMFFLITYAMLNIVVIIEQNLRLISFRPLFKVHTWVPWVGLITSVFAMFIINPVISIIAVILVVLVYGILLQQKLTTPFEDVRSGLLTVLAEWAAKTTSQFAHRQERAWKPNLLIPFHNPESIKGMFSFLKEIVLPQGSVKLLGIGNEKNDDALARQVNTLSKEFQHDGVFSSWAVIKINNFSDGVNLANQAYRGSFLKPNIIFLELTRQKFYTEQFSRIIDEAARLQVGVLIYSQHPEYGLGKRQAINVWIRNRAPNWKISWDIGNLDLSILVAYKLERNWHAKVRLVTVVDNKEQKDQAEKFMTDLMDQARMPHTKSVVYIGDFMQQIKHAPPADLNIFGLVPNPEFNFMESMVKKTQTTCLFIRDSGLENIFA